MRGNVVTIMNATCFASALALLLALLLLTTADPQEDPAECAHSGVQILEKLILQVGVPGIEVSQTLLESLGKAMLRHDRRRGGL